jgi:hypothetical protein
MLNGGSLVCRRLPGVGQKTFNPEPAATVELHLAMFWQDDTAFQLTRSPLVALSPSPLASG